MQLQRNHPVESSVTFKVTQQRDQLQTSYPVGNNWHAIIYVICIILLIKSKIVKQLKKSALNLDYDYSSCGKEKIGYKSSKAGASFWV